MTVYTPSVRDPFTQQVSVKIGITLDRFYADLVHETGIPVNTHYREALSRFALDPCSHEDYLKKQERASQNEKRVLELEEEVKRLRLIALPIHLPVREENRSGIVLSDDHLLRNPVEPEDTLEEIQAAFSDNKVMETFVKLAQLIENEEIDPEQEAIVNHFTTLCPHIKVRRVLDAISEVGYRVEHRQVEPKAARLLALYISFHPETTDAISAA